MAGGAGEPLTQDQLRLLASHVFGSWKFWAALVLLIGAASWAVVTVADKIIDSRTKKKVAELASRNSNQMGAALGQISNQINSAFKQPRIKSAIDAAAWAQAGDLFSNGIKPSVESFQDAVEQARAQLASATNLIAELQSNALAAQKRIPPPVTNQIASVAPAVTPPVATPPAPVDVVKLTLINRSIVPAGSNYLLTLFFHTIGTPTSGPVEMAVATYKQTARILNFAPMTSLPFQPPVINAAGDIAQLQFNVTDREPPTLVLEVSAPTIVRFISDSMEGNLTVPIAAEKMLIPGPSN